MGAKENLDAITYEILRHRLFSILQEGRYAMARVSGSPVATEAKETMTAIYKANGDIVLTSAGVFLHISGVADEIRYLIDNYSENPGINEGDIFFFNDPYLGGIHTNDIASIQPIFYDGELVAWASGLVHTAEIGAIQPGGMPGDATEVFHEGFSIPGLKIVEKRVLRQDALRYLERATRAPGMIILDTKARNASCYAIESGFLELINRYGKDVVLAMFDRLIEESEILARKKVEKLPDGVWSQEIFVDHDGFDYAIKRVKCTMTKKGDHITFDYSGTSDQTGGSVNCAWHGAMGSLYVALAGLLFWDVPWNEGMAKPVTAIFPEGSMVNCRFPASCAQCPPSPGIPITTAAWICISKMLAITDEFRGDLTAAWSVGLCWLSYGGMDQYGTRTGSMLMDPFASGCGAGYDRDGVDTGGCQMTPESDCADVETYEAAGPILYLFRKHRMDSAGPGKYRGGAGMEIAHMVHNTPELYISEHGMGEKITTSVGIWGGYPSSSGIQILLEDGEAVKEELENGRIPWTIEECQKIKGAKKMPLYYGKIVPEGATGVFHTTGGGGYGDPLERDPEKVKVDVESFIHSIEVAKDVYGVILDPDSYLIDWDKTEKQREKIRQQRLSRGKREE